MTSTSPAAVGALGLIAMYGSQASPRWSRSWIQHESVCCASAAEHRQVDDALQGFARWEVDFGRKTIRSALCDKLTTNDDGICDACTKIAADSSLIHAINRHQIELDRVKYSNRLFPGLEGRNLDLLLKDPLCEATLDGKLKDYETVKEMCMVVAETIRRKDAKSYGGNSARQYGILSAEIPLPSMRHVRALIPKSEDALRNPYLIFENMAAARRLDSLFGAVRKRLCYSNDFSGHILGSIWALEECIAEDPQDIERVINEITKAKAEPTQVRAILIKVPLLHIPPQAVALLSTNGTDDAAGIFEQNLKLLAMAA
ncbi:hypothetical protein B0H14DRAFT_2567669 [Mycena olivaceomarginata]|nr:hypothetical protein B0H14DRAFT_2567669 [Mycena olivaceomarginata]